MNAISVQNYTIIVVNVKLQILLLRVRLAMLDIIWMVRANVLLILVLLIIVKHVISAVILPLVLSVKHHTIYLMIKKVVNLVIQQSLIVQPVMVQMLLLCVKLALIHTFYLKINVKPVMVGCWIVHNAILREIQLHAIIAVLVIILPQTELHA